MLRNLGLILLICSSLISKANVRDSIPNGLPANIFHAWVENTRQFAADSGFLAYKNDDTTAKPKSIYSAIKFLAGKPYYWDGTGWRAFAAPSTGFVLYSDSTTIFVTPTQQNDSLLDYVNRYSFQTIPVTAPKTWNSLQTFNDTVGISAVLKMTVPRKSIDRWGYNDSVQNIDPDGAFIFSDRINNLNSVASKSKSPGNLVTIRHQLLLDKQQDTLNLKSYTASALNITTNFRRNNSSDDTVKVIPTVSSFPLRTLAIGLEETSDTSLVPHSYPYFKINIPYAALYTYAAMTNHGVLDEFDDLNIGYTTYLDDNSDSANAITNHYGLLIQNLASNPINIHSYAIDQRGSLDTVRFHSQNIKLDNLKSTLTPAFRVLADANGNLLQKTYLSGSATLDFPSTDAGNVSDLTITVTGATNGDPVTLGTPNAAVTTTGEYFAWCSAPNTITIRFSPKATENPASATFKVIVTPL